MKRLILATLFFCVCSSSITNTELDFSLKGLAIEGVVALVLVFGALKYEHIKETSNFIETQLPYASILPTRNETCFYQYGYPCKKSSTLSCLQQTELFCELQLDESKLSDCYITEYCEKEEELRPSFIAWLKSKIH